MACVQVDVEEGRASIRGSARTESLSAAVEAAGFSTRPTAVGLDDKELGDPALSCEGPASVSAPESIVENSRGDNSGTCPVPPRKSGPSDSATPATAGLGNLADNRTVLEVKGMSCGACVAAIERLLLSYPGVHQASVALLTERAEVEGHLCNSG